MKENRPLAEQMAQLNAPDTTTENSYMDGSSLRNETCPAALLRSIDESLERIPQTSKQPRPAVQREKPAEPAPCRKEMSATYKISLCDVFSREGKCPYGTSCRFAHGKNELRMPRPPRNVKFGATSFMAPVKPARGRCRNFMAGNCRFGERCYYSHQIDSSEMPKLMNTTIQPYINQSFSEMSRQFESPPQAMYPQMQPDFNQTLPAQGTTYYYQQVQQPAQQQQQFAQFQQYPYYMMNHPPSLLPPPQQQQQYPYYQMYPPLPPPMIQQNVQYYQ